LKFRALVKVLVNMVRNSRVNLFDDFEVSLSSIL